MTEKEALKLALEALENVYGKGKRCEAAIAAIKQVLAQPEREWQGLTDEELGKVLGFQEYTTASTKVTLTALSRAVEAKLRSKNT